MKRDMGIYESEAMQIRKYRQKTEMWDRMRNLMKEDINYKMNYNTANKNFKKDEN